MEDPFWTHDTHLFDGTFRRHRRGENQPIRGKVHVNGERYDVTGFGHSLERSSLKAAQGKRIYMLMHPYVIVPNVTMTLALYPKPKQYADAGESVGHVTRTQVDGLRDIQIGSAQAWYYPDDKVLVLWECYLEDSFRDAPLLKDSNMSQLWEGFEKWLRNRYPETERIITPFADPIWEVKEYQSFLRARGYKRGKPGTFTRLLK